MNERRVRDALRSSIVILIHANVESGEWGIEADGENDELRLAAGRVSEAIRDSVERELIQEIA